MAKRLPASMRTRQNLSELIEGRLSSSAGRSELVELAARLIVEEALEEESRDALGRDYYERGGDADRGYRNGVREGRLKTAEGIISFSAPQIADSEEPFRSEIRQHLKGRTEALEDLAIEFLARGLSVRDIEDAFPGYRQGRERSAVTVEDGSLGDRRAAMARLSGVLPARSRRARDHLSLRRRHCRAHPAGAEARAGARRLGHRHGRQEGSLGLDGGVERGCRDCRGVLPGHAFTWARRSAPGRQRWRSRHHQGDRDLLPALGPPALPGASHAQSRRQGSRESMAGLQGQGAGRLPGPKPGDRTRLGRGRRQRPRGRAAQCGRLLSGRLRGLHRPSAAADYASSGDSHHGWDRQDFPARSRYSCAVRPTSWRSVARRLEASPDSLFSSCRFEAAAHAPFVDGCERQAATKCS